MNEQENGYAVIDLLDLLKAVWHYRLIVILFLIVGVSVSVVQTVYFTPDTYTASGVIYVSSKSNYGDETITEVDKGDIDAARILSTTYIETLKTRSFLNSVSKENKYSYSWQQIKNMTVFSTINDTELLSVKVTAPTAKDAYWLAHSILKLAPDTLSKIARGGSIEILDEVQVPTEPDDKGLLKRIIMGGLLGAVLAGILIFAITFFDNKVRNSEDIEKRYNVSVLGILDN